MPTPSIINDTKTALERAATNAGIFEDLYLSYPHCTPSRPALKGRNTLAQGTALCIRSCNPESVQP
jgi:hypothetical protein